MPIPKVSIIVPIYNVEPYLKQCVDSIRGQTLQEIEIILVDDGSPDRCPQLCDQFAEEDERIRVFHQKNAGVSVARNMGIELARADWIMFVDPDDWLESRALEVLHQKGIETGCGIVCGTYYTNFAEKQSLAPITLGREREYVVTQDLELLIKNMVGLDPSGSGSVLVVPWGKIYRTSFLKENHIIFPIGLKQGQDQVFSIYAVRYAEKVYILDFPVYHYRIWNGSVSCRTLQNRAAVYRRLRREYSLALERCLPEAKVKIYNDSMIIKLYGSLSQMMGRNVRNARDFRIAVTQLKDFAQEPACVNAAQDIDIKLMPTTKKKISLWLLKHRMYRTTIFMRFVYIKLFPNR